MKNIHTRLLELASEQQTLLRQLSDKRAALRFKCACGKTHAIKDCEAIQDHWYTSPSGCTGGDYWNEGELYIVCPITDVKNRLMFSNYDIDYSVRRHYEHNAGLQFKRTYKGLFKSVVDDYDKDKRASYNNFFIDLNHKKFGLCVKGRDYKTYGVK